MKTKDEDDLLDLVSLLDQVKYYICPTLFVNFYRRIGLSVIGEILAARKFSRVF